MSRARTRSVFDDLIGLIATLPWWVGVGLAIGTHVVLGTFAEPSQTAQTIRPADAVFRGFAAVGQYLVPFICLLGAALSVWHRAQRSNIAREVANSGAAHALNDMSWREFETLVGEAFRLQGFRVVETGGGGADGGVDLKLTKRGETFLVQCKQWKAYKVGVDVIRELYGVMAASGAAGGFVVTSGRFTDEAKSFSDGRNVWLVDGPRLKAMLERARSEKQTAGGGEPSARDAKFPAATPTCPTCGAAMILRTTKRGSMAGSRFWGCSTYPACRGTREASAGRQSVLGGPSTHEGLTAFSAMRHLPAKRC